MTLKEREENGTAHDSCLYELEQLKEQLAAERRSASDMAIEIITLKAQLQTTDNLKSVQRMGEDQRHNHLSKVYLDLKDANNTIIELREELKNEHNAKQSLGLQLQKTIESNSELLLEIKDLENSLQERERIISKLEKEIDILREKDEGNDLEAATAIWMGKIHECESENCQLREAVTSLEAVVREHESTDVGTLRKQFEHIENESHSLRRENMNLILQIKEMKYKVSTKDDLISQLEAELVIMQDQSLFKEKTLEMEAEKLQAIVNDMRPKLQLLEDERQRHEKCTSELNSTIGELYLRISELEMNLKSSEVKCASLIDEVKHLMQINHEHEKERALLASQRGQLKGLREKMAIIMEDHEKALKKIEDLEVTNTAIVQETNDIGETKQALQEKLKEHSKLLEDLTQKEIELTKMEALNRELEEQMNHALLKASQAVNELDGSEAKFIVLARDLKLAQEQLKDVEDELVKAKSANVELKEGYEKAQQECASLKSTKDELRDLEDKLSQIAATKEEQDILRESSSKLEKMVHDLQQQNNYLSDKLADVEGKLVKAMEDNQQHTLRKSADELESLVQILQLQNNDLSDKLKDVQEKLLKAEATKEEQDALTKSLPKLESMVDDLQLQHNDLSDKLPAVSESNGPLCCELERGQKNEAMKQGELEVALHKIDHPAMGNHHTAIECEERIISGCEKERQQHSAQAQIQNMENALLEAQATKASLQGQLEKMQQENKVQESHIKNLQQELSSIKHNHPMSKSKGAFRASLIHEMKLDHEAVKVNFEKKKLIMENEKLQEDLKRWKEKAKLGDEVIFQLKHHKLALEERVHDLSAHGGKKGNNDHELAKLRKQTNEQKRKILEHEEEKEELKKRSFLLQKELQKKNEFLAVAEKQLKEREREERVNNKEIKVHTKANHRVALSNNLRDGEDSAKLKEKIKFLEDNLKKKTVELEATKFILKEKDAELSTRQAIITNQLPSGKNQLEGELEKSTCSSA